MYSEVLSSKYISLFLNPFPYLQVYLQGKLSVLLGQRICALVILIDIAKIPFSGVVSFAPHQQCIKVAISPTALSI